MLLEGHVQPVLSLDFNPSGYEVITASSDNSLRVHDLRKLKSSLHIIPAHTNIVSAIKFRYQYQHRPSNSMDCASDGEGYSDSLGSYYGDCMVSASFDGTAKIWGVGDWRLLKTLAGHESKIMDVDISNGKREY